MLRMTAAASAVVILAGCATGQQQARTPRPAAQVVTQPTPVCSTRRQCDVMWAEAREAAQKISGMRIRMMTDTFIDTFQPRLGPGVQVSKFPIGEGRYEIRAQLQCRDPDCDGLHASAMNAFNALVSAAGMGVRD
jgi:hypothetical protein